MQFFLLAFVWRHKKRYEKGFLFSIITAIFSLFISVGLSNWIINSQVEVKQNATLTSPGGIIECYKVNNDKEESAPYAKFCTLEGAIASANDTVKTSSKVNMYLKTGSFIDVRNKNLTLNEVRPKCWTNQQEGLFLYEVHEGIQIRMR